MRRSIAVAATAALVLSAHVVYAQEHQHDATPATTTHSAYAARGTTIALHSTVGDGSGYLSLPADGSGKHPALIVIQEWWGLNDWVKEQADRLSGEGYVALAVDLYRGKVAADPELAHELMRGLPPDRGIADLKAGIDFLSSRSDVDPKRIGVIGWCMGGGYSLQLAIADSRIAACVINYGSLVTDPATIMKIKAPILGNFGELDRGIPPQDVKAFEAALIKAGRSPDIKIYAGAGHAFENPNNTQGYVPAAAKDAQARIDAFFARTLRR